MKQNKIVKFNRIKYLYYGSSIASDLTPRKCTNIFFIKEFRAKGSHILAYINVCGCSSESSSGSSDLLERGFDKMSFISICNEIEWHKEIEIENKRDKRRVRGSDREREGRESW